MESEMVKWLREYLKNTPAEQIKKDWKELGDDLTGILIESISDNDNTKLTVKWLEENGFTPHSGSDIIHLINWQKGDLWIHESSDGFFYNKEIDLITVQDVLNLFS